MVKFDGSFMEWKNRRKMEVWVYIHSLVNSYFKFFFERDLNYPSAAIQPSSSSSSIH
jgi:hypothetical protein